MVHNGHPVPAWPVIEHSGVTPSASRYGTTDGDGCEDPQRPVGREIWGGDQSGYGHLSSPGLV